MTNFENFFGGNIFVINLEKRADRLDHFAAEMEKCKITCWTRFEAIDTGPGWGNHGCTASHRALLDLIVRRGLKRAFIFEDDATLRDCISNFNVEAAPAIRDIPAEFDMFYFGGHYGSDPRGWFSKHLILMGEMKTTSSYGVTLESARELRDLIPIGSGDSIDNLYANYNATKRCYITEPRFFVQYDNYSDLQQRVMNNAPSMEDGSHVARLGQPRSKPVLAPNTPLRKKHNPRPVIVRPRSDIPSWNGQPKYI